MEPGERWGYREKKGAPLVPVDVLQIGTRRPARVRVRFVDEEFEGREDWVPPARLKVAWEEAEQWMERERQWAAVEDSAPGPTDPRVLACEHVLEEIDQASIDGLECNFHDGALAVTDVAALAKNRGIDVGAIAQDPIGFTTDDGTVVVSWETAMEIVPALAREHADLLLDYVRKREEKARLEAVYGRTYYRRGDYQHISAEICAQVDATYRPVHELIRSWCGAEAVDRHDELVALREEVLRLGSLVERGVAALRTAGRAKDADEIERDLGVPVETVRHEVADQYERQRRLADASGP